MRLDKILLFRLVLLLPAAILVSAAVPRIEAGFAVDAVFPVPVYVVMNVPLPAASYRAAADILSAADDGQTLIQRAELMSLAGAPAKAVTDLLREGLSRSPSSTRGWVLLAEQLKELDKSVAGEALTHSLMIGPYEYYVAGRRARDAVLLWNALSTDGQDSALRQTRLLWTTTDLNRELLPLLRSTDGAILVMHSFAGEPDELRALNRWVAIARRSPATKP